MGEPSEPTRPDGRVSRSDGEAFHVLLRELARRTGKPTRGQQASALGVKPQSFSRWMTGDGLPNAENLDVILRNGGVPAKEWDRIRALRRRADEERRRRLGDPRNGANGSAGSPGTNGSGRGGIPPLPPEAPGDHLPAPLPEGSWWARGWRKAVLGGLTGSLCLAGVLFTLHRDEPDEPLPPVDPACDHYEVTAETLFRRDAEGRVIDQFVRDERLEVLRRNGSAGNGYWYVSGSGGKRGWVDPDPRWVRPLC